MFKYQHVFDENAFRYIVISNEDELTGQVQKINLNIKADLIMIAVRENHTVTSLITISGQDKIDNVTYELNGSPCKEVLDNGICCFSRDVSALFPDDNALKEMGVEGYIGSPITNENNESIGTLVALYNQPQKNLTSSVNMLELFTEYISTFIQKCHLDNRTSSHLSLLNQVEALSNTGSWEYQVRTEKVFWSDEVFRIYGVPSGDPYTLANAISFYAEHERPVIARLFEAALVEGQPYEAELEFIDAIGTKKWVKTNGVPECDNDGNVIRVYGAFEDISAQKEQLLLNKERAHRIEDILNNINDAVITINSKGIIQHSNNVALRVFGYHSGELEGINISTLMPEPYAAMHQQFMEHYEITGKSRIIGVGRQLPAKRKNGDIFQMELAITKTVNHGETQYIGVIRDITERLEAQDTIYNLAFTDNVTFLRNSQWFEKECKDLMKRAGVNESYIHILLLDIDKMAQLNLQVGFNKGDKVLKMVAANLKEAIGLDYKIYKFDADSFIVLSNKSYSKSQLHKFRPTLIEKALLHPNNFIVDLDEQKLTLTASLGSAIFEPTNKSFETMLNILEHALRKAKNDAPFGLHHVAEEGINEYYRYLTIQELLKTIVDSGELSLAMQPQCNNEGRINSFEALVRWNSSQFGYISPSDFIPIAEESDAIIKIGDWVLLNACKAIKELIEKGLNTSVSINISAKQIAAPNFISKLVNLVRQFDIPAELVVLELTETALVANITVVKSAMEKLSKHGFRFSVDDFGTGYSSLAYLKELPIFEFKIDKYFVDDIEGIDKPCAIIDAIIDMAKALGVRCVAEGVENQLQYDYLKRKGCDIYQGYLFSKPVNMDTWRKIITIESNQILA
ncbi:EAL domain-containing protein [Colwelliaceae bacterium 6471]